MKYYSKFSSHASSGSHFDYPYDCIYQLIIEDFVVEIPPWSLFDVFINAFFINF